MYPVSGCSTGSTTALAEVDSPLTVPQSSSSAAADRDTFLHQLCDPKHRFHWDDSHALCKWLEDVVWKCPKWPQGTALQWCDPGDSSKSGSARSADAVLRVRAGLNVQGGHPVEGLFLKWDMAADGRTRQEQSERFTCVPDDLFDAIARSVSEYWVRFTDGRAWGAQAHGMSLRKQVADWLRTPEGSGSKLPVLTGGAGAPNRVGQPPRWPAWDVPPCAPWRDLRTVSREELDAAVAEAVHSREAAAAALLRAAALAPPVDTLGEAIRTLREGGWSDSLEHLVPTILARLPRNHPMHVDALRVHHPDGATRYGPSISGLIRYFIRREPDGTYLHHFAQEAPQLCESTPDTFLSLVQNRFTRPQRLNVAAMREELAQIIALNPEPLRLRLALAKQGLPLDQELLMRLCLVNGQLTAAGRQVMDPNLPQRRVRVSDLARWFLPGESALTRRPEQLAADGISVIDAHFHASPAGLTLKGRSLLREGDSDVGELALQPQTQALVEERFAHLLYAYGALRLLMAYMGDRRRSPRELGVSDEMQQAASYVAANAKAAEQLTVPPESSVMPRSRR